MQSLPTLVLFLTLAASALAQSNPVVRGTFDHHTVRLAVTGLFQTPSYSVTNTYTQSSVSVPIDFRPSFSGSNFQISGTLALNFPPTTPDARISSLNTLIFDGPRLQVGSAINGQYLVNPSATNNFTWILATRLAMDATDEFPGCPASSNNLGPPVAPGTHPVALVRDCSSHSIAFPIQQGPDLLYEIATSLSMDMFAPSNPPGSRVIFLVTAEVQSYYRVSTAASIDLNENSLSFIVGETNPPPQIVQLKNVGSTNLTFAVNTATTDGANWLTVTPSTGTLAAQQTTNLSVAINAALLPAQVTNNAEISVSGNAPNSPQRVQVEAVQAIARLVGLEAVQVVQDWRNSVPLIGDKRTLVRAHIESFTTNQVRVEGALLRGFRNGAELAGSPLSPANAGGFVMASTNAALRRGEGTAALNFFLPTNWLTGVVDLRLDAPGVLCREIAGTPNDCTTRLTFEPAAELQVNLVRVKWFETNGTEVTATMDQAQELANRLVASFPIAKLHWITTEITWTNPGPTDVAPLLHAVDYQRVLDRCANGCERISYGFLAGSRGGGIAYTPGQASVGWLDRPTGFGRNRHAHELGHNLGRGHATLAVLGTNAAGRRLGFCGETARPANPDFPFFFEIGGSTNAALGPMTSGANDIAYGYDSNLGQIVDPFRTHELMGYCAGVTGWRWPSTDTYTNLHARRVHLTETVVFESAIVERKNSSFFPGL